MASVTVYFEILIVVGIIRGHEEGESCVIGTFQRKASTTIILEREVAKTTTSEVNSDTASREGRNSATDI